MIIEICATSIESILNAQNAGAHRFELCENYSIVINKRKKRWKEKKRTLF